MKETASVPSEKRISDILDELKSTLEKERLQLGQLLASLQERGPYFMIMILSIPFLQPVSLPGVSTPFGFLIALLGAGVLMRREVPIPERILRYSMNPKGISMLFRGAIALFRRLERWSKPRWERFLGREAFRRLHALLIVIHAILLMLPLPIPFSNSLPAYVIFFIALGYLLRDGAMVIAAYCFSILTAAYFIGIAVLGFEGVQWLVR
jgi:hypothetical protein